MWKLLSKILGWFLNRGEANIVEITDSNARAQEQLTKEREANALGTKAANVRSDADDRVVRALTDGEDTSDAARKAKLREQFPDAFRD